MDDKLHPRRVIGWGIAFIVVGVVLPIVSDALILTVQNSSAPTGQALIPFFVEVLSAVRASATPLGAAILGAGLVMLYLERRIPATKSRAVSNAMSTPDDSETLLR